MLLLLTTGAVVLMVLVEETTEEAKGAQYRQYLKSYSRKWGGRQEAFRQFVFYSTYDELIFNKKHLDESFSQGINQFSDLLES